MTDRKPEKIPNGMPGFKKMFSLIIASRFPTNLFQIHMFLVLCVNLYLFYELQYHPALYFLLSVVIFDFPSFTSIMSLLGQ